MQLKANAWHEDESPSVASEAPGTVYTGSTCASRTSGRPELAPIPARELEIARLARGKSASTNQETPLEDGPAPYVTIALHRERLGITETGGYFTLKMRLVRTLRRGFRSSIIEVDDADTAPDCDAELFRVNVEPADPKAYARAVRTVRRVLRSRHRR